MPGPVSDSYDPEWGSHAGEIDDVLEAAYDRVSGILGGRAPLDIRELVRRSDLDRPNSATLTGARMARAAVRSGTRAGVSLAPYRPGPQGKTGGCWPDPSPGRTTRIPWVRGGGCGALRFPIT
jgi:hypothetical protein